MVKLANVGIGTCPQRADAAIADASLRFRRCLRVTLVLGVDRLITRSNNLMGNAVATEATEAIVGVQQSLYVNGRTGAGARGSYFALFARSRRAGS